MHASPRILAITCSAPHFPVSVVSAHAPHADRPDKEARQFWHELHAVVHRVPPSRALVVGLDANGDFHASDSEGYLIGDLLARSEPGRNDDLLLEFCLTQGLEAPATFSDYQQGPSWTWQHTSGRQKRIDHLLFRPGPWSHHLLAQAFDFDIVNGARDHVAIRARSTLFCPQRPPAASPARRANREEVKQFGEELWARMRPQHCRWEHPDDMLAHLSHDFHRITQDLPPRPAFQPRQAYLHEQTVSLLLYLKDWRSQVRVLLRDLHRQQAAWSAWRGRSQSLRFEISQQRLVLGAYTLQEHRLQARVHSLARKDKIRHFETLTAAAAEEWHATGQPMRAILHLKWASKRSAERRTVHAAGGYDIGDALEEQFRAQEGGLRVTKPQLDSRLSAWQNRPTTTCSSALPSLTDIEQCCLRQKDGKASGPDAIPNELWRHFPVHAGRWLWRICAYTALSGREPSHFKKALQCALYKKGPASLPSNYRSIALLNGVAKIWHSHIRSTIGLAVLNHYDSFQLGGRRRIPVSFAVATYRTIWDLSVQAGRCVFALFVDIQAAYYETSRQLLFDGDPHLTTPATPRHQHLAQLTAELLQQGALEVLGIAQAERDLLQDCIACSHWQMVGSDNIFIATRGSRPGDGLADVLFGALFTLALRHIKRACSAEGIVHIAAGANIGRPDEVIPVGWADDLAILVDFDDPSSLQRLAPRVADITISTLEHLRFRVNLGRGKTESMLDVRGHTAKQVRGDMLSGDSTLSLPDLREIRITAEYRYLGVIQQPRDTGRRDQELALQRAQAAWAQARGLLGSASLPWSLKHAWAAGRVLPAAYATRATSTAVSGRATAPLEGFFEKTTRALALSWQHGHVLSKPSLCLFAGLTSPTVATTIARVRLVVQLCVQAPAPVWAVFEAGWNRATTLCDLLTDACGQVLPATSLPDKHITLPLVQRHATAFLTACKHLSRFGTIYQAFWELWHDITTPRSKKVLGVPGTYVCPLCRQSLPSLHALAAHTHRRHSVVNSLTRFTDGTTCLWCHTNHHTTDRLKYHLRTSPHCLHGLRVQVGPVYTYGSGTKRRGAGGHRGLPPTRIPGPLNATPAQRLAASEGRRVNEQELLQELQSTVGVSDVYSWPETYPAEESSPRADDESEHTPARPTQDLARPYSRDDSPIAYWRVADAFDPQAHALPSPFWPGLRRQCICWGLPAAWHRWWSLWLAAESVANPWSKQAKRAQKPLRPGPSEGVAQHCRFLRCLASNTIAFRQICMQVNDQSMLWIPGVPSTAGRNLLRRLLPRAAFSVVQTADQPIFVAAASTAAARDGCSLLASALSVPVGKLLQPLPVYHTRSQDKD